MATLDDAQLLLASLSDAIKSPVARTQHFCDLTNDRVQNCGGSTHLHCSTSDSAFAPNSHDSLEFLECILFLNYSAI